MPEYSINDQTEHIIGEVCYCTVPGYVVSPLDTADSPVRSRNTESLLALMD